MSLRDLLAERGLKLVLGRRRGDRLVPRVHLSRSADLFRYEQRARFDLDL